MVSKRPEGFHDVLVCHLVKRVQLQLQDWYELNLAKIPKQQFENISAYISSNTCVVREP